MKKLGMGLLVTLLLGSAAAVLANGKVKIHEEPVTIIQEGETFVVPEQTATRYYYHTVNNSRYVCTVEEPAELVGIEGTMVEIRVAGQPQKVRCYPETNFILEP